MDRHRTHMVCNGFRKVYLENRLRIHQEPVSHRYQIKWMSIEHWVICIVIEPFVSGHIILGSFSFFLNDAKCILISPTIDKIRICITYVQRRIRFFFGMVHNFTEMNVQRSAFSASISIDELEYLFCFILFLYLNVLKLFVCIMRICPNVHSSLSMSFKYPLRHCFCAPVNYHRSEIWNVMAIKFTERIKFIYRSNFEKNDLGIDPIKLSIYFLPFGARTKTIEYVIISKGERFLEPDLRWRNKGKFNDCQDGSGHNGEPKHLKEKIQRRKKKRIQNRQTTS